MISSFGQIPSRPFQASGPVQCFRRWCSLATPHECLPSWLIMFRPFWTMTIAILQGAKVKRLRERRELDGYLAAVLYRQLPHQRGKMLVKEASTHTTASYLRLGSSLLLLSNIPQQGRFLQRNIMDTHSSLRSFHLPNIIIVYRCHLHGLSKIRMGPTREICK